MTQNMAKLVNPNTGYPDTSSYKKLEGLKVNLKPVNPSTSCHPVMDATLEYHDRFLIAMMPTERSTETRLLICWVAHVY